jgi:trimethyllysine dioxygenase
MGDTSYSDVALNAHTDNTYFVRQLKKLTSMFLNHVSGYIQTDPSGLQLFHILSHTGGSGGATLLVDGFYVAETLKARHPDLYPLLSNITIPAHAAGDEGTLYQASPKSGYPVLNHDPVTKELHQVRWNNDDRSVMDHLDPEVVEKW